MNLPDPTSSSPAVLAYRNAPQVVSAPYGNPAAGISGMIISIATLGMALLSIVAARYTELGVFLAWVSIGFWPLGTCLSIVGVVRPGGRGYGAVGLLVSFGGFATAGLIGWEAIRLGW